MCIVSAIVLISDFLLNLFFIREISVIMIMCIVCLLIAMRTKLNDWVFVFIYSVSQAQIGAILFGYAFYSSDMNIKSIILLVFHVFFSGYYIYKNYKEKFYLFLILTLSKSANLLYSFSNFVLIILLISQKINKLKHLLVLMAIPKLLYAIVAVYMIVVKGEDLGVSGFNLTILILLYCILAWIAFRQLYHEDIIWLEKPSLTDTRNNGKPKKRE